MSLVLHSDRLTLRPYEESDADFDVGMATDPAVMEFFGGAVTEAESRAESESFLRRGAGGCIGVWTVLDRNDGERLGQVYLTPLPVEADDTEWHLIGGDDWPDGEIEIGYLFRRVAWGKGIATEASMRLLRFAFDETPLTEVVAVIEDGNAASRNVLKKCGFVSEGLRPAYGGEKPFFRLTRERFDAISSIGED